MVQYIRVFYGSDGLVHFMTFADAYHNGQYAEKHIGQGLINNILNTPIYYKDDITAEQLIQLAICLEELERLCEFKVWSVAAGQARRDYIEGKISGEEMVSKVSVD